MVFSSIKFLFVFLPAVLFLYYLAYSCLKKSQRLFIYLNLVLLLAGIEFYIEGEPHYLWVMLLVGGLDYWTSQWIFAEQESNEGRNTLKSKLLLWFSIGANMGLLVYFKYTGFFIETFQELFGMSISSAKLLNIALPIGISFYTFESMSYTIDVYHRETPPSRNLINYWTFITFFPHLIAGPIIRYVELRKQLENRHHSATQVLDGVHRFIIGLGKKVIIANPMAYHADYLFSLDPNKMDGSVAWMAALTYTLQIYFDFSGYSDMAIGLGKMFAIELPENFNFPYAAKTVQDFWRRWHMTLSRWFRDYFYIPLGGNRKGLLKEYRNLWLVFFVCGLWHGASMNFIAWGMWHGSFLVLERNMKAFIPLSPPAFLSRIYTLLVVIFGWVLFRADTLTQATQIWKAMLRPFNNPESFGVISQPYFWIYFLLGMFFAFPHPLMKLKAREVVYVVIFFVSVAFLCGQEYNPFIYFRF